ncbi:MAG: acyltransferase family protein [Oscillibacter sp.]|nr:acyltransferase family protein [Oscillibacter sp.]
MPKRQSNMELLRIVSMYLIIVFHAAFHSGFLLYPPPTYLTYNILTVRIFWFFGEWGVNLFVLISGYFQVNGHFKWKKLFLLLAQVLFYSLLGNLAAFYTGAVQFSGFAVVLKRSAFPIIRSQYWFATAYVIIYLLSPYMNLLIKSMDEKTFRRLLFTLLSLYCVIPTFWGLIIGNTESSLYYSRLIWFFIIYFIGAYIRLYPLPSRFMKYPLLCALGTFAFMVSSIFVIYALNRALGSTQEIAYFWPPNTIPMLILSVSTFYAFLQLNIPYVSWINCVASTTFGIYLFHDGILRQWIWKTLCRFTERVDSPVLIPQILAVCAGIFFVGMTIDFARQAIERVTLKKWLSSEHFLRFETRFDVNPTKRKL